MESEGSGSAEAVIPSLPEDVAVNCIARVPIEHHQILSAVSRPMRNLVSSPVLYAARSHLGTAQPILHLSIRSHRPPFNSWFALLPNHPYLTRLPPVPAPSVGAAIAVSGHQIYALGGSVADAPSTHVWILDCRSRSWRPGPPMRVGREFAAAGVVAGRIYALGGCAGDTSWARAAHWAEVLDPGGADRWLAVPSPAEARDNRWMHASAVVGGRIFAMADRGGVVFDAEAGVWDRVDGELDLGWRGRACVIDGVLYCYDYLGKIRGFDVANGGRVWREVKGLVGAVPKFLCGATMANVGGSLMVAWEEKGMIAGGGMRVVDIWCADIEVKRSADGDLLGMVRWSRKILSAPAGSSIIHCVSVSL